MVLILRDARTPVVPLAGMQGMAAGTALAADRGCTVTAKAKTEAKPRVPSFSTEVYVDIDPEDLHDAGWHHESECGDEVVEDAELPALPNEDVRALGSAVASLHRQAHPGQARSISLCREEPCRSLTLAQLGEVDG